MVLTAAHPSPSLITLTPGASFRQYTLLEQIGVGGQGVVWSALDQDRDCICAVKFNEIFESDEAQADDMRDEHQFQQLIKLQHVHIVPLVEFGFHERLRFTVCPYLPGGTLTQKIRSKSLSRNDALSLGMEIASALDYLHGQGVIHRDLKSSNILLDIRGRSYLADFGLARVISTSTLAFHTGHGTPPYAPPEQNSLKSITAKSDIYSFGILLYEMFTGQLPWDGKKQLGMEQLYSKQELPDPCEVDESLPPRMVDVLRRVTSADPEQRPRSAGEVMRMICYIFNVPYKPVSDKHQHEMTEGYSDEVSELLRQGLAQWESTEGMYNLGMTRFVLVSLKRKNINTNVFNNFLLSQALTYGYDDDQWWLAVSDPQERLAISSLLLRKNNEAVAARIMEHLTGDMEIRSFSGGVPQNIMTSFYEISAKTGNAYLCTQILHGIRELTHPEKAWNDTALSLSASQIKHLGDLALEDSEAGDAAAELIGHLRATPAVQVVANHHNEERKVAALLLIQQTAGNLPPIVQGGIRFRVKVEWAVQLLIQQPVRLVGAYVMAFLGAALGMGIQVYLTYNLPDFLDVARFTTSLEQGLIVGAVLGLGIFMTRMVTERFQTSRAWTRLLLGTFAGGLGINIALLVFHVLFLNTPPKGLLIASGSIIIAFAFTVGGLTRSYIAKAFLTSASILAVIIATWWLHINFATSPVELTPILRYDYAWSLAQVSLAALGVALPIGILGNAVNLSLKDE